MIKIALVSVISVLLIQITKQYKSEYSLLLKLASVMLIIFLIFNEFRQFGNNIDFFKDEQTEFSSYIPIMLKTLAVALITELASSICKDSGENALQTVVELAGKISILIICMPLFEALFDLTAGLIEV